MEKNCQFVAQHDTFKLSIHSTEIEERTVASLVEERRKGLTTTAPPRKQQKGGYFMRIEFTHPTGLRRRWRGEQQRSDYRDDQSDAAVHVTSARGAIALPSTRATGVLAFC
jgi:hypothetical protein